MRWLWLAGGLLLAIAAGATWFAFHDPRFVAGLTAVATAALWKAFAPVILKPETPEARAERQEAQRHNDKVPTKLNRHPNEGGHH